MLAYTTAVIVAIVVLSLVLVLVSRKSGFFNARLIMLTGVGSAVASCSFAWIYSTFLGLDVGNAGYLNAMPALLISVILIIIMMLVIAIFISSIPGQRHFNKLIEVSDGLRSGEGLADINVPEEGVSFNNLHLGTGQPTPEFNTIGLKGHENNVEAYINEAFRKKESGDFEGAAEAYISALEEKPADSLAFLIVLDICTVYKELGMKDLATYILESYVFNYAHLMDEDIRFQIEAELSSD